MLIIIIGCGKVGAKFAQVLSEEGHDVVIVDNDSKSFKSLSPDYNGLTVTGVPIDQDVLKKAGIQNADALAAVTPDDNVNIMVCQVAKEIFKVPRVIARIYNPEREFVFHQFGLETICPTNITVDIIRSKILGQDIAKQTIGNSIISFKYIKILEDEDTCRLCDIKTESNTRPFGIIQNGDFKFADPAYFLKKGDILVLAEK